MRTPPEMRQNTKVARYRLMMPVFWQPKLDSEPVSLDDGDWTEALARS